MNWKDKHNLFFKLLRLHFGLALYSIGLTLGIQANIGLAPWEAFGIGVSYVTGLTYGTINVLSGLLILVVTVAMGERFGLGTILNAVLIGFGVDVLQYYHAVPLIENYWLGIIVMFLGQFSISLGTYFYISAGLGSGPRDSDDRVKTSAAESSDWYDQRPYRRQCFAGWLAAGSEGWFRYYNSCVWHQYYFAVDF